MASWFLSICISVAETAGDGLEGAFCCPAKLPLEYSLHICIIILLDSQVPENDPDQSRG